MKRFKNTLEISRLDCVNITNGRLTGLPMVTDIKDTKVDEVYEIRSYFETKEEAVLFAGKFPKSYLAKVNKIGGYDFKTNESYEYYVVKFRFDVFWLNEKTGEINESALKRRAKVIAKIKELNN
jgi:hypothetical protein